jgi:uncharacterized protein YrrD
MLRSINALKDYAIHAIDGNIGHVKDFYFDDTRWVIRYLIVQTGSWLVNRKVLISPIAIPKSNWDDKTFPVTITMEQVKNSPAIDTDKPVSRQHEDDYLRYYDYPNYWGSAGLWGVGIYPSLMMQGYVNNTIPGDTRTREESTNAAHEHDEDRHARDDIHLRSCEAVTGYHLHASDGNIGHITDILVDEQTWAIRYLIVETGNWWSGHKVLIAPLWIDDVQWLEKRVNVKLTRQEVKGAPLFDDNVPIDREFETDTYQHYQRSGYWIHETELP